MKIIFTNHAYDRMMERDISKRSVGRALVYGFTTLQSDGSYKKTLQFPEKKLIVIASVISRDECVVITTYYEN